MPKEKRKKEKLGPTKRCMRKGYRKTGTWNFIRKELATVTVDTVQFADM